MLLPLELKAGAVLIAAVGLFAGYRHFINTEQAKGAATCEAAHVEADSAESSRRIAAQKDIDNETQRLAARARIDHDRLSASVDRVRPSIDALFKRCDPAPTAVSASASSTDDLYTNMRSRLESSIRSTIDYADEAVRNGGECSAKYDSLKK